MVFYCCLSECHRILPSGMGLLRYYYTGCFCSFVKYNSFCMYVAILDVVLDEDTVFWPY